MPSGWRWCAITRPKVSIDGRMPQVEETYLVSEGRPAAVVDATNVNFMKSMPAPVLPAATNNTTCSTRTVARLRFE